MTAEENARIEGHHRWCPGCSTRKLIERVKVDSLGLVGVLSIRVYVCWKVIEREHVTWSFVPAVSRILRFSSAYRVAPRTSRLIDSLTLRQKATLRLQQSHLLQLHRRSSANNILNMNSNSYPHQHANHKEGPRLSCTSRHPTKRLKCLIPTRRQHRNMLPP